MNYYIFLSVLSLLCFGISQNCVQAVDNSQHITTDHNLLNESWKRVQTLENTISNNSATREKRDDNLANIESDSMASNQRLRYILNARGQVEKRNLLCTCQSYPTSCADFDRANCAENKCRISNQLYGQRSFLVSCNDNDEGGGWTVIQRRTNGSVDFYRDWSEYKDGFGNIDGEFFIGLDKLHALTTTLQPVELLIQLGDFDNTMKYAKYDEFQVANETENYKLLKLGSYTGNAGNAFIFHVSYSFTTKDRDNDNDDGRNCAVVKTGAWWYNACAMANLNGKYYKDGVVPKDERGIYWYNFHGFNYSLKFVQMMIRPKNFK